MSFCTSIKIHPVDSKARPTFDQLRLILRYLEVVEFGTLAVSPSIPMMEKLRRRLFPRLIESYPEVADLVWKQNIPVEEGLSYLQHPKAYSSHMLLKATGWSMRLTEYLDAQVPLEVANSFDGSKYLPWDTGLHFGPWDALDFKTGKRIAEGRFYISRSGPSYPRDSQVYLSTFEKLPPIRELKSHLESTCALPFMLSVEMT